LRAYNLPLGSQLTRRQRQIGNLKPKHILGPRNSFHLPSATEKFAEFNSQIFFFQIRPKIAEILP